MPFLPASGLRPLQRSTILLALAAALIPHPGAARATQDQLLVSTEWLAQHLGDPDLVLLHVGPEEEYHQEHIPGAHFISPRMLAAPEDEANADRLNLELPDPQALTNTLEDLGIGDDSRIVVYYGTDWVTPSTRVIFTLDWIGLGSQTSLLDGGMQKWKAGGRPVAVDTTPAPIPGALTPRVRDELVVSAEWVLDHLEKEGIRMVDARAPDHYLGVRPTYRNGEPVRPGHIPGAANLYAATLVGENLRLKPREELARMFEEAGVSPGDTVVAYCHLGQFATLVIFGARILGYPVRLYDGSFQEWGDREELPVELPRGPGESWPLM